MVVFFSYFCFETEKPKKEQQTDFFVKLISVKSLWTKNILPAVKRYNLILTWTNGFSKHVKLLLT